VGIAVTETEQTPPAQTPEETFQTAASIAKIGLWVSTGAEDETTWNAAMRDIMACYPMSSQAYVEKLVHPEDRTELQKQLGDVQAGKRMSMAYRIVRDDGEVRWVLHRAARRQSAERAGEQTINVIVDITGVDGFHVRPSATHAGDVVSTVTAGVAHNFNNLLAIIRPALDLATRRLSPLELPYLEDAKEAADRASELVKQLMLYASQRSTPAPQMVNLREIVLNVAALCQHSFGNSVRLEVAVQSETTDVVANEIALDRAIMNVLINAKDACVESGRDQRCIKVVVDDACTVHPHEVPGVPRRFLCVSVEDDGIGMGSDTIQHAFEPFFTTKQPGKGTGLGLATSERTIRRHGGFMRIESEPGLWTRVSIYLPSPAGRAATAPSKPTHATVVEHRGTVMIVDDEPAVRRVTGALLRAERYAVSEAANGEECVAQIDNGLRPDLILLDYHMPGWSSARTVTAIRERLPGARLIFFTAQEVPDEERARVLDVLSKPFKTEELVRRVEGWILRGR